MVNDLLFDGLFDLKILLELSRESFHLQVEMALFLLLFIPSEARPFDDDVESTHSRQSDGHVLDNLKDAKRTRLIPLDSWKVWNIRWHVNLRTSKKLLTKQCLAIGWVARGLHRRLKFRLEL